MNHFNSKSLAFYGAAIGLVLLLFKVVTAYGEQNLKAPPVVNGRYRLTLAENLPNCEQPSPLLLNIQQSGIYLNASLLPANANANTEKQHSLTGLFQNQQSSLSGKVDGNILCNTPVAQSDRNKLVTIQMKLVDQGKITGQLTVNGISQSLGFTAMLQKDQEKSQKSNSH
ncbi:hypothetical protein I8748_07630 [Nostoc sp. CENA67]|uniref:Uncharacterized protein n=1 Tax=Amazonocrinis nigriterrae CENA67 TaxID=2794033 RepID=A0A8J7L791_9NOST|nr:hypothetical protein [Amazonocrinis nigriterrae]MBH8562043.1 hypothetical protein [Amazonocrinis nigriterrae CENA67]